jgi:hypothetical protein
MIWGELDFLLDFAKLCFVHFLLSSFFINCNNGPAPLTVFYVQIFEKA